MGHRARLPVFDPDPVRLALGSEREVRRDGLHFTTLGAEAVGAALFELLAESSAASPSYAATP